MPDPRDGYLEYPHRRYGMDHDRYDWSALVQREPIRWPRGARLALWVMIILDSYRPDAPKPPFLPPGTPTRTHFDYMEWSYRDYGLRVGVFRLLQILTKYGIRPTVAMVSDVCRRAPGLVEAIVHSGAEIIGHGVASNVVLHAGLDRDAERAAIAEALDTLRSASGQPVTGWLSPGMSESLRTPDLLAEQGVEYLCDWANDDVPYPLRAGGRTIVALPCPWDAGDYAVCWEAHHPPAQFSAQLVERFRFLDQEAGRGGRCLGIGLHPWISGQPYRAAWLDRALADIADSPDVWKVTGSEIVAAFTQQQSMQR